jgi:hypothetical protein
VTSTSRQRYVPACGLFTGVVRDQIPVDRAERRRRHAGVIVGTGERAQAIPKAVESAVSVALDGSGELLFHGRKDVSSMGGARFERAAPCL